MGLIIQLATLIGVALLILKGKKIMATLADILAEEKVEGGEISQLVDAFHAQDKLIADLKAQIAAFVPSTLTAEQQAAINETFAQAEANKAALVAAIPAAATPTDEVLPPPPGSTEGPGEH